MTKTLLFLTFTLISTLGRAIEIKFNDTTAKKLEVDFQNRLYITLSRKVVRYKLTGELDKEYKIHSKDSLLRSFLMPNLETILITKNSKYFYVLDENFQLIDSVDTKKKAGFSPQQILSVAKDEFAVLNTVTNKISTYAYDFQWKAEINYDVSNLGNSWYFVNGFGGGYRYFYSSDSKGILRTDNNGGMLGFVPIGSNVHEFFVNVRDRKEKAYIYLSGSFVEVSFDNINDVMIKASINSDKELTAILLNEVAVKLYKDRLVTQNVQLNF